MQTLGLADETPLTTISAADNPNPLNYFGSEPLTLAGLDRPYRVASGTVTSVQSLDTILTSLNFPDDLFSQPPIARLIAGYRYMRWDAIHLVVRFNAPRFAQGALLITAAPCSIYREAADTYGYGATGFPHCICDVTSSDANDLDIPFIWPETAFDLQSTTQPIKPAIAHLSVFNTIQNVTTLDELSVGYVIWANFVNPTVFYPIANPSTAFHAQSDVLQDTAESIANAASAAPVTIGKVAKGFLSKTKDVAGKVLDTVAGDFIGGAISSIFGFAKPMDLSHADRRTLVLADDVTHCEGMDNTVNISFRTNAHIDTNVPVVGRSVREMDIEHVAGTPMLAWRHSLNAADHYVIPVHPGATYGFNTSAYKPTYASYVTRAFANARPSVGFLIYVVSSPFQTGRLRISYLPGLSTSDALSRVVTGTEPDNCYHNVYDIESTTVIKFVVPYPCSKPSIDTYFPDPNDTLTETGMGALVFTWVSQLSGPNLTRTPNVWLNIYHWLTPDSQFFMPLCLNLPTELTPPLLVQDAPFVSQYAPRSDVAGADYFHPGMSGSVIEGLVWGGDKVESIKQLLSVYFSGSVWQQYGITNGGQFVGSTSMTFQPNAFDDVLVEQATSGSSSTFNILNTHSWFLYFARIFAFYRGSLNVKLHHTVNRKTTTIATYGPDVTPGPLYGTPLAIFDSDVRPITEFNIPFYREYPFETTSSERLNRNRIVVQVTTRQDRSGETPAPTVQDGMADIYYAAGDDFEFMYLIPPLTLVVGT